MHKQYKKVKQAGASSIEVNNELLVSYKRKSFCPLTGDILGNIESPVNLGKLQARRQDLVDEIKDIDDLVQDVNNAIDAKQIELTEGS